MVSFQQEVINLLCKANQTLVEIRDKKQNQETIKGTYNSWVGVKAGKSWFLERLVTLSGTTITINLDLIDHIKSLQKRDVLPGAFQINRIETVFNDTTARSFSIRIFTNPAYSQYVELYSKTSDISLNTLMQAGIEYKYPAEFRIQFYYSSFTADKTVRIRIQVDEL